MYVPFPKPAVTPGARWIMFSPLWMEHEGTALKLE